MYNFSSYSRHAWTFILQQLNPQVYPIAIYIFSTLPRYLIIYPWSTSPWFISFYFCKRIWKVFAKQYYCQERMLWDWKPASCCKNRIVSLNRALRYLPTWVMMSLWDTCPFGSLPSSHESAITISVKWNESAKSAECRRSAAKSEMQLSEQSVTILKAKSALHS